MGSLDVNLLFTNITLAEIIDICTNTIYSPEDVMECINWEEFQNLLTLATKEYYINKRMELQWDLPWVQL